MDVMVGFRRGRSAEFSRLIRCGLVAVGLLSLWSVARADSPSDEPPATDEVIDAALRYEVAGMNRARNRLLDGMLDERPNCDAARWHMGQVRLAGKWVHVDDVPALAEGDSCYQEYVDIRPQYGATVSEQVGLGIWCRQRGMEEHARAHFLVALELSPDNAEVRELLGYQWVDGDWATKDQIVAAGKRRRVASRWTGTLTRYRRALRHRNEEVRERARARCLAIDDPEAIPAIERVFARSSEEDARFAIEMLKGMKHHKASRALMRLAVFSDRPAIAYEAAEQLRSRPLESFIPQMLAMLWTPIEVRSEFRRDVGSAQEEGDLQTEAEFVRQLGDRVGFIHRLIAQREGRALIQQEVLDKPYPTMSGAGATLIINTRIADLKRRVSVQNERIMAVNLRVCSALNFVTAQRMPVQPDTWWQWWDERNETLAAEKPVRQTYRQDVSAFSFGARYHSCFAAGTRVWTMEGAKPIERIEAGDFVLSQHPDTGELAYKPVVRTTVGPPLRLVRIRVGDDIIECTGGHLFWVAGDGWVRASQLAHCNALHGVAGTSLVDTVDTGPVERAYNLDVDGFHTYFVGQEKLLVHDVTEQAPTLAVVPGLSQ